MSETLASWFARWLVERRHRVHSRSRDDSNFRTWIEPSLGTRQLARIKSAHIREWVRKLDDAVRAGAIRWSTARGAWGLARAIFRDACSSKIDALIVRESDPTEGVQPPDRGPEREATFLYPSEAAALLGCRAIDRHVRRVYALAMYLYPRAGELAALRCEDVDVERGIVRIHRAIDRTGETRETKTSHNRTWLAEPAILPLLRALSNDAGGRGPLAPEWSRETYARDLRRHLRAAGVTRADLYADDTTRRPITGHDLRATGITWRAMRGDSIADIQEAVGHRSTLTTERYIRRGRALARAFDGAAFAPLPDELLESGRGSREDRETMGACRQCGAPATGARCRACRVTAARYERQRRKRLRRARLCLVCGETAHVTLSGVQRRYCERHLAYYRERAKIAAILRRSKKDPTFFT